MYRHLLTLGEKVTPLYSNQHYSQPALRKLILEVVGELKEVGLKLTRKNAAEMVQRELIQNHEFISCVELNTVVNLDGLHIIEE